MTTARALALSLAAVLVCAGPAPAVSAQQRKKQVDDGRVPMLVLGRTQLLETPGGFPEFCAQNAKRKRGDIRKDVLARLKEIAADEQPKILAALDSLGAPTKEHRSLWIVNAVVVPMTGEEVEKARELDVVKWVYPAGSVVPEGDPGKVEEVIRQKPRKAFSRKRKTIPWNLEKLRVPEVWDELGVTGEGVLVVSIDHGLNYMQEDLERNIWINADEKPNNGKDDDGNGLVDDLYGFDFARWKADIRDTGQRQHGTLTSCLVIGDGTGGTVTGVAPRAKLMPVIAMGGPYNSARAFQYALEEGGDIVSMSFSIPDLGHTRGLWRRMAEHATAAGLVLVSGAGNFQKQARIPVQIRIPEGIPCLICVGGVMPVPDAPEPVEGEEPPPEFQVPDFVSLGPVEWASVKFYGDHPMPEGLVKPDVCAFPGPRVGLVATRDKGYLPENNGRRGNSLSAPQVAGVCALMLSANPELTPWRVKEILEETAQDILPAGKDPRSGAGLVDALAAVKGALAATTR